MSTTHTIINGDSRQMNLIKDKSVQLIITSPPYWQLKDYGTATQIGYHEDYETYINNLNLVWKECHRVLDNGCRMCINIGDQFARAVYYGRYKVIPIRTEIIKFCESIGFDYMGAIIWQKKTTTNTTGGASLMGSFPTPRNGILSLDYEFILIFKKLGKPTTKVTKEIKEQSRMTTAEWKEYFAGHWHFGGTRQDGHIAMFPEELPKRLIKMFAFKGETVLDPFMGSGTTALAARNLERNSIGYEINSDFIATAKKKLGTENANPAEATYTFQKDNINLDIETAFAKLPYRFVDFQNLDKQTDPKKKQFGSKIDKNSKQREEYFSVKEILSPELLRLSNDAVVRLIGVKSKKGATASAKEFLALKTKNQKVYMKYDAERYDAGGNVLCYLYLKNKTFLNAHLIKGGYAKADRETEYKNKKKFIGLEDGYAKGDS